MRFLLVVLTSFILSGCATKVTSLKSDKDKISTNGTGYLLIGVETNRDLKSIRISGPDNILLSSLDLRQGSNFILVDISAGEYVIEKVELNNYWHVKIADKEYWNINILPGKINYVGHINIASNGFWQVSYHTELVNKSSYALEFMEDKFPNILTKRKMHYGGPGTDTFFKFTRQNLNGVSPK
jgi:hypothetical protein